MDLNDPRRRLQVLNNASPSLRIATAPATPQPQITIAQPKTPQIALPQTQVQDTPQVPQVNPNSFKSLSKTGEKNKTIFGTNAAWLLPKGNEKVATYGAGNDYQANPQDFLKQFDNLDEAGGIKGAYVADLQKKSATDPVAANTLRVLQENGRFKGSFTDFASGANDKLYGGMSRGFLRGVDFVLPGHNTFGLEQEANRQEVPKQFTTAGKVGEKVGSVEKGVVDVAAMFAGGTAAEQAASKIPGYAKYLEDLQKGGKAAQIAAKALGIIPGSLGGSVVNSVQTAGKGEKQNVLKSILEGTAVDLGIPILGKGISKLDEATGGYGGRAIDKTLGKGISWLSGKLGRGGSEPEKVFKSLISSKDESAISRQLEKLAPDADKATLDEVAKYISKENNPDAVRAALQTLDSTPAADAATGIQFHDPSHPTQEWLNQNMPGMRPTGAPDPVPAVLEKAKSFENADEFKKYINGLSGEDKAAAESAVSELGPDEFYNRAKQQEAAAKQSGTSLPEEDLAAIKEAGGTPPVEDPGTVFHLPEAGVHAKLTPEQAAYLSDETKNIPWTKEDRPHLTAGDKVRQSTKEVTQEELGQLSPNAKTALDNAPKAVADTQTAKAVEDVSKAQTGTSDGQVTGSGETTNAQALQGDIPSKVDESTITGESAVKSAENGSQGVMPQKAEDIVPNGDENTKNAVQQVLDSLNSAQKGYDAKVPVVSAEKGARAGGMAPAYDAAGGGEAGVRAKLSQLKGKYTQSGYTPISVDPQVEKTLLDNIEKSDLQDFEKLNTQNALRKVWGATPEKPAQHDINYIRKYFDTHYGDGVGQEISDALTEAISKSDSSYQDVAANIAGLPRAMMATGDFSGGGRQALPLGTRYPKEWANANKESVKYAFNPKYYESEMKKIADASDFEVVADKLGVALPGAGTNAEEQFLGANYAEKIPGAGHVVKGADRAYTGVMTRLRYDVSHNMIEKSGGPEAYVKAMQELYGDKADRAMNAYGEVINTFTGRGGKKGGITDEHMKSLSTALFAPRLWVGNVQRLNPAWYIRLARDNPAAAKLALQTQGTFLTTVGTILGVAGIAGAQVGTDPRSADFGKIKVGNTRYDVMGGQQQNVRYISQMVSGKKIDSTTGEVATIGDGYTAKTRKDITYDLLEGKENPLIAFGTKLLSTKIDKNGGITDEYGKPFNPLLETGKLFVPLNVQGTAETANDTGSLKDPKNIAKAAAMNLPGFFGVGVQTYGNTATKDQGTDANGKLAFKGKITPDMVTDNNGKPILDEKGRVVKVKFDKDATDLQKQAQLDEARRSALKSEFTRTLSKEDQQLMKLSDKELQGYVDNGKIDQEKFDQIQRNQKGSETYGNNIEVPKGANSKPAATFYQKFNSMTKKDQEYWLKEGPDDNAKTIATQLNKQRSKGLSEYKPSNELSKAYAEYEKDINTHPDYTEVDMRNKAKAFQTFAYKLNYNQNTRDVFQEGGSSDLKTLVDNKQISKEDLDSAMKLDEELYNSGLTGSLKFSKKFRTAYGYGTPDGGSGPNGGGSGSDSSTNQHLADYLPNRGSASQGEKPTFSSKRRTTGISFKNVNAPKTSSSKKISINL